jgi:hypothetical protein
MSVADASLAVLAWIVPVTGAAVVVAIVLLVWSGRAVPAPWHRLRGRAWLR